MDPSRGNVNFRGKSSDMVTKKHEDRLSVVNPGNKKPNNHEEDTHAGHCRPEIPNKVGASHLPGHGSSHIEPEISSKKVEVIVVGPEPNALTKNIGITLGKEVA